MDLQHLVTSTAAKLSLMRQTDMRPEHTLLGDIGMDGDDFSYSFVPGLEKALGIRTSQSDWSGVLTIRDVVLMLQNKIQE